MPVVRNLGRNPVLVFFEGKAERRKKVQRNEEVQVAGGDVLAFKLQQPECVYFRIVEETGKSSSQVALHSCSEACAPAARASAAGLQPGSANDVSKLQENIVLQEQVVAGRNPSTSQQGQIQQKEHEHPGALPAAAPPYQKSTDAVFGDRNIVPGEEFPGLGGDAGEAGKGAIVQNDQSEVEARQERQAENNLRREQREDQGQQEDASSRQGGEVSGRHKMSERFPSMEIRYEDEGEQEHNEDYGLIDDADVDQEEAAAEDDDQEHEVDVEIRDEANEEGDDNLEQAHVGHDQLPQVPSEASRRSMPRLVIHHKDTSGRKSLLHGGKDADEKREEEEGEKQERDDCAAGAKRRKIESTSSSSGAKLYDATSSKGASSAAQQRSRHQIGAVSISLSGGARTLVRNPPLFSVQHQLHGSTSHLCKPSCIRADAAVNVIQQGRSSSSSSSHLVFPANAKINDNKADGTTTHTTTTAVNSVFLGGQHPVGPGAHTSRLSSSRSSLSTSRTACGRGAAALLRMMQRMRGKDVWCQLNAVGLRGALHTLFRELEEESGPPPLGIINVDQQQQLALQQLEGQRDYSVDKNTGSVALQMLAQYCRSAGEEKVASLRRLVQADFASTPDVACGLAQRLAARLLHQHQQHTVLPASEASRRSDTLLLLVELLWPLGGSHSWNWHVLANALRGSSSTTSPSTGRRHEEDECANMIARLFEREDASRDHLEVRKAGGIRIADTGDEQQPRRLVQAWLNGFASCSTVASKCFLQSDVASCVFWYAKRLHLVEEREEERKKSAPQQEIQQENEIAGGRHLGGGAEAGGVNQNSEHNSSMSKEKNRELRVQLTKHLDASGRLQNWCLDLLRYSARDDGRGEDVEDEMEEDRDASRFLLLAWLFQSPAEFESWDAENFFHNLHCQISLSRRTSCAAAGKRPALEEDGLNEQDKNRINPEDLAWIFADDVDDVDGQKERIVVLLGAQLMKRAAAAGAGWLPLHQWFPVLLAHADGSDVVFRSVCTSLDAVPLDRLSGVASDMLRSVAPGTNTPALWEIFRSLLTRLVDGSALLKQQHQEPVEMCAGESQSNNNEHGHLHIDSHLKMLSVAVSDQLEASTLIVAGTLLPSCLRVLEEHTRERAIYQMHDSQEPEDEPAPRVELHPSLVGVLEILLLIQRRGNLFVESGVDGGDHDEQLLHQRNSSSITSNYCPANSKKDGGQQLQMPVEPVQLDHRGLLEEVRKAVGQPGGQEEARADDGLHEDAINANKGNDNEDHVASSNESNAFARAKVKFFVEEASLRFFKRAVVLPTSTLTSNGVVLSTGSSQGPNARTLNSRTPMLLTKTIPVSACGLLAEFAEAYLQSQKALADPGVEARVVYLWNNLWAEA
ncbi:unnamed protein product [Amoebophrya sp. A25]|nr:unnamed protein product [Amoebophrya sp. A25]|eukprot:GSA25T00010942001.1